MGKLEKENNEFTHKVVVDVFFGGKENVKYFNNQRVAQKYADEMNAKNIQDMYSFASVEEVNNTQKDATAKTTVWDELAKEAEQKQNNTQFNQKSL